MVELVNVNFNRGLLPPQLLLPLRYHAVLLHQTALVPLGEIESDDGPK